MEAKRTLFHRIGGEKTIMAAAEAFYERLLADPRTAPFFEGLDIQAQARKQVAFLTWAFGGPQEYRGRDLTAAHAHLVERGLGAEHFDAVVAHLRATLVELRVPGDLIEEALAEVAATRPLVLGG